jgi:PAS domain S-box-containing protein
MILSDYSLPGFDGHAALLIARTLRPDLPFLFVSGTIGEDRAVESLKGGATDFVLKDRFARLEPAVRRALAEAAERAARRRAEEALRQSEERYALAARGANDGLWDWDVLANKVYLSPRWKAMLGWRDDEVGDDPREWMERVDPQDSAALRARLESHLEGSTEHFESEYRIAHRDGSCRWMLCRGLAVRDGEGRPLRIAGSQTDQPRLVHGPPHPSSRIRANSSPPSRATVSPGRSHPSSLRANAISSCCAFRSTSSSWTPPSCMAWSSTPRRSRSCAASSPSVTTWACR